MRQTFYAAVFLPLFFGLAASGQSKDNPFDYINKNQPVHVNGGLVRIKYTDKTEPANVDMVVRLERNCGNKGWQRLRDFPMCNLTSYELKGSKIIFDYIYSRVIEDTQDVICDQRQTETFDFTNACDSQNPAAPQHHTQDVPASDSRAVNEG